jgi:peptidoglycan hydrolase-like protein with peptidoglycan-binding domain
MRLVMALKSPRFASNARLQRASQNSPAMFRGETGEAVRLVQQALIDLDYSLPISTRRFGSPDGIYGDETASRVRELQADYYLSRDGATGRETLATLDDLLPGPAPPLPPLPPAGKYLYKISLHLRTIDMPQVPELTQLRVAQEVFRQYSIDVEMASGMSLLLSDDEQLELHVVDGDCKWDQVSDEQRLLQGKGREGVGPNDIVVYFATTLREQNGNTLQGCAGHAPGKPAVMVAADAVDKTTMAHEVCHVLLGPKFSPVHVDGNTKNLMTGAAVCTGNPASLTDDQLAAVRKSRYCKKLF